uniref:Uncharacterized protein n=1 Tax=viral metagenome TaxID=1070528 RepID=A0A6C0C3S8_9ZZZZ
MQRIDVSLPNDKIVIEFIQQRDIDKIKWLKLGKTMHKQGMEEIKCFNNEEYQTNITNIKKMYEDKIVKLNNNLEQERDTKKEMLKIHNSKLISLQQQISEQVKILYSEKIQQLESIIQEKKIIIDKKNDKIDSYTTKMYKEMQDKLDEKEDIWLKRYETIKESYEVKLDIERKKTEKQLLRQENSTLIGQDGEALCEQQLNLMCPSASVLDTHSQAGRGDFVLSLKGVNVMIENKNYTKNVPKPEILKFYRDIKTNGDIHCGILCSQKSGICAKEDYSLEIIEGKPIMMLYHTAKHPNKIKLAIDLLLAYVNNESINLDDKEILDKLKNFSPTLKKNLSKMKKLIKKFENDITTCLINEEEITKQIFATLKIK